MLELYKNIKKRREELKVTQQTLAEKIGYADKTMISKIENGLVDLPQTKIIAIAKALHTTPGALMGDANVIPPYDNIHQIAKKSLPVLGSVACGKPIYMAEEKEVYVDATTDIKADFILIAKGDSMTGARINDGDIVFVRQQPEVENGEIAVVAIDDEATLKRFYKYNDMILLKAENPEYKDMVYTPEDHKEVRVLGKAVAFQSDVR